MLGPPQGFWGKLESRPGGEPIAWHPLEAHCADVAAVCERLLTDSILNHRIAALCGWSRLGETQIARLCVLAALHDLGKFNRGFQNKASRVLPMAGHVREVLALFHSDGTAAQQLAQSLPLDEFARWGSARPPGDTTLRLLVAAIGHHGRPVRPDAGGVPHPELWRSGSEERDPFHGIAQLVSATRRWFPAAFEGESLPFPEHPPLQHAFSGLVMLADWLGSDRRAFEFAQPGEDRMPEARERARRFLAAMGLDPGPARRSLGAQPPGFDRIRADAPRALQQAVLELPLPQAASVVVLEAETGAGKTEAAAAYFLRMFHAGAVDSLYFALPTRTAATQIFGRLRAIAERAFPPADRPAVVLGVPGYLAVDDVSGIRLPGFEVLWNDDTAERYRFRGWAAETPKRYLAGSIAVGTVDQVLLSALLVSHAHLRATALARSLLVVDEVHASDAYMNGILAEVIRFHTAMGGHVLLMSATLGSSARLRLAPPGADRSPVPLQEAIGTAYPSLWLHEAGKLAQRRAIAPDCPPKSVTVETTPMAEDPEAVATLALAAARAGAAVLVVRNTVSDCIATQRALESAASTVDRALLHCCARVPAPHHSRYARCDREALDHAVEQAFGPQRTSGGRILVATQTVQQSLDLDADLLLSDLCPVDVLLQRIGRLHRHRRARPAAFEIARCLVLVPTERDLLMRCRASGEPSGSSGLGTVYDDLRVLEATWRILESRRTISIPADNRALVETASHPEALRAIVSSDPRWSQHEVWVLGGKAAHERLASLQLVDRSCPFGDYQFPDRDLSGRISTRIGASDRRIELPSCPGAFGGRVTELSIPEWWARGAGEDAAPSEICPSEAGFSFCYAGREFVYDRLGLRSGGSGDGRHRVRSARGTPVPRTPRSGVSAMLAACAARAAGARGGDRV